jgi:hypothetical protein
MKIVSKNNINVYYNLAQAYEAEFSILTNKLPKADGLYSLDTQINYEDIIGYIYYHDNVPIGVTAILYNTKHAQTWAWLRISS